jgi:virginiamycin B lyase
MRRNIHLAKENRKGLILMMGVAITASARMPLEAQNASLTGVIRNAAGEAVAGALVKVRSEGLGLGFMVVSQEQGRYNIPNLLPGKYTVQGFGGDSQSGPMEPVEIGTGQPRKLDLVLSAALKVPPREKRLTDADYAKLLPEGPAQRVVAGKCAFCHSLLDVISARKTPEKWKETYERMYDDLYGMRKPIVAQSNEDQENAVVLDYLSKNFGPNTPQDPRVVSQWFLQPGGPSHPNRNLPTTLLKGAAAKFFAMEFSLPPGSTPHDIAVDSQGIAWVSERNTGMLGRFDPASMTYTRTASPPGKTAKFQLDSVAVDPQGQVWFVDDGPNARMLQFNPQSKAFNTYPIPEYHFPVPDQGWARVATLRFLNGDVWATGVTSQRILRLDPSTRKFIVYSVPRGSAPYGLAIGGDKLLWYAARIANVVVRLDASTGKLTRHDSPTLRSGLRGLAADSEGNLWAAATESGKLVKVDYRTGAVTEYAPPSEDSGPYSIDVDTKRNLVWFSEIYSDKIGRYDPASNTFLEFPQPIADSDVRRIAVDPSRPNRVWWASARGDKIGYIEVVE